MLTPFTRCSIRARAQAPFSTSSSLLLRHFTNTTRRQTNSITPSKVPSSQSKTPSKPTLTPKVPNQAHPNRTPLEHSRTERIQQIAQNLLSTGHSEIYQNTASRGFVAASVSIFVASCAGIGTIYGTKLWNREETKRRGLPWFVSVGNQATMVIWGFLAAYVLSRTFGLVKSMRLVRVAGTGVKSERVMLETMVRRPVPFLKPERIVSDPETLAFSRAKLYAAVMSDDMIVAAEGDGFVTKAMRTLFYQPFNQIRKVFGSVSLVSVNVGPEGEKRYLVLDADGVFGSGGQDLLDLSKDEV